MRHLKDNLLFEFSVVSLVVMVATAAILAALISDRIRSHAVDVLVDEAVGATSGRLLKAITTADLQTPMTGERYNSFNAFVESSIVSERTVRIKLWSKDGTVIYSDDPSGVGQTFPDKENLLKALAGETATEVSTPEDLDNKTERDMGVLMEVYAPILFPGNPEPQGVFELYQRYAPTAQWIDSMRLWTFGAMGVAFLALYGSLVAIVWRGWTTITEQRRRLESFNTALDEQVQARTSELQEANRELASEVAEKELAQEELGRRAQEMARSNAELEHFAYVASHDLQEPLRMVTSYTQLLARRYKGQLDAEADEFIAYAVDGVSRMQGLINDLLAYSRVNSRGKPFEPVDCSFIVEQVLNNLQEAIKDNHALVTYDALPTVQADSLQFIQLFQNLIANAIKFHGDTPPQVHVSARPKDKGWLFSVADNGIGIEPQYAERIFLLFQRLHSRNEYPGTGIGLSVCKRIVERHGGRVWVESEKGKGATFYFTIPEKGGMAA